MDKIPIEVFTKITSYLRCSEKLQLLLVCHYWHNAIKYTNLYSDFAVKGRRRFQECMTFFQEQSYTSQVKKIQLTKPEMDTPTVLALPSKFPQLQQLIYEDYSNDPNVGLPLPSSIEHHLEHWKKLTSITETNSCMYMPMLLELTTFPQLTHLVINVHFPSGTVSNNVIPHLDNAPLLKRLELSHISLSLQQVEQLHEKTPHLEHLSLNDVTQDSSDFDIQFEYQFDLVQLQPAMKLHTLHLERLSISGVVYGVEERWLKYISKKYTQMVNFSISGVGMGSNLQPYYETALALIAKGCTIIKSYTIKIYPLTSRILEAMDSSGTELQTLDILSDATADDQLTDLLNSQQRNSLENITIKSFNGGDNIFELLQDFPWLKHLNIRSTATITINTALNKLKHLESLHLSSCDICLDLSDTDIVELKLQTLKLEKVMIINAVPTGIEGEPDANVQVFDYIAKSCPYLSTLCVQGQVSAKHRGPLMVHFPLQYFRSIKVYILGNTWYQVDNHRNITWYKFRGKTLLDSIVNDDLYMNQFHISVVYKGFTNFNIGGTSIPNW